jgi:hypothetical protein
MDKWGFGQSYCKDLIKSILKKFTSHFYEFILFSMDFRILNEFLEILIGKRILEFEKTLNSAWAEIGPRPGSTGLAQRPNQPRPAQLRGVLRAHAMVTAHRWWGWRGSRRRCGSPTGVGSPRRALGRQGKCSEKWEERWSSPRRRLDVGVVEGYRHGGGPQRRRRRGARTLGGELHGTSL